MHDACVLVGLIDGGVVAPYCVVAVSIVVAEVGRLYVCFLGHDAVQISVLCKNDRGICSANGGLQTFLWAKRKELGIK